MERLSRAANTAIDSPRPNLPTSRGRHQPQFLDSLYGGCYSIAAITSLDTGGSRILP